MSAKQDRTAARTPEDLERKYKFDQSFSEIMGIATDARTTAESAKAIAENATNLTPEEVFNLLTDNGALKGIFKDDDGEIYINASYLRSGIIDAAVVKIINLIAERLWSNKDNAELLIEGAMIEMRSNSNDGKVLSAATLCADEDGCARLYMQDKAEHFAEMSPKKILITHTGDTSTSYVELGFDDDFKKSFVITDILNGMTVSWEPNGDGTYRLIGTEVN